MTTHRDPPLPVVSRDFCGTFPRNLGGGVTHSCVRVAADLEAPRRSESGAAGVEDGAMFIVKVAARAKNGAREQFLQVLGEQIEEVPQRFPLCLTYRACVDAIDPHAFRVRGMGQP